jgi:hypothetical protein
MTRLLCAFLISVAAVSPAGAQSRPDFSGTWAMDEQRSGSPAVVPFVRPVIWVIKQSGQMMVVDITRGDKTQTFTYTLLDKAPATKTASDGSNRGFWDGNRLVTETIQNISGQTVTMREVRTLLEGGQEMSVERVVEVEHGYTFKGAQNFSTVKDVFVRRAQ